MPNTTAQKNAQLPASAVTEDMGSVVRRKTAFQETHPEAIKDYVHLKRYSDSQRHTVVTTAAEIRCGPLYKRKGFGMFFFNNYIACAHYLK